MLLRTLDTFTFFSLEVEEGNCKANDNFESHILYESSSLYLFVVKPEVVGAS